MLNLFALFYLQKRSLIFNRDGFWISFVHMTLPLFFSISVAYILVQAKLESYFCFLRGLLNLTDRNRAWDNIPKNEREKGILPVIVSQNKTLSLERSDSWNTRNKPSWRTVVGGPAWQRTGYVCWKAICGPFFLMVYRFKFCTLHFKCWGLFVLTFDHNRYKF